MLLLPPAVSRAEMVGAMTAVQGGVDILRVGQTMAGPLRYGDPVSMGDIIRTKKDGKAEIQFKDETVVRLAPESRLRIDEYTFSSGSGRQNGFLSLLRGKVRAVVAKVKSGIIPVAAGVSNFTIKTPTASAGVRGTDFFVFYTKGVTGVVFREGSGFVFNPATPNRIVTISAGQATFVMKMDASPLPPRHVSEGDMGGLLKDTTSDRPKGASNGSGDSGQQTGQNQGGSQGQGNGNGNGGHGDSSGENNGGGGHENGGGDHGDSAGHSGEGNGHGGEGSGQAAAAAPGAARPEYSVSVEVVSATAQYDTVNANIGGLPVAITQPAGEHVIQIPVVTPPPPPPITEKKRELLTTPVTVNVMFPTGK